MSLWKRHKNIQSMVSPFLQNSSASFSLTATPLLAIMIAHAKAIAAATNGNEKPPMMEKHKLTSVCLLPFDSSESPSLGAQSSTQNLRRVGGLWRYRSSGDTYMLEACCITYPRRQRFLHVTQLAAGGEELGGVPRRMTSRFGRRERENLLFDS
jgi:hypothetical protein